MKFKLILSILCVHSVVLYAQDAKVNYWGIDAGFKLLVGEMKDNEAIRKEISDVDFVNSISDIEPYGRLSSFSNTWNIGVNREFFFHNDKLGVMTGLRFTKVSSLIGRSNNNVNNVEYFYFLYNEEGTNTEYLKVNEINQSTTYIGVPVEFRYFILKPSFFSLYFKIGGEFGLKVQTKTKAVFSKSTMSHYEDDIEDRLDKPSKYFSALYGAAGIRVGRVGRPTVSGELHAPYFMLSSKTFTFNDAQVGVGLNINIQIPISILQ